MHRSIDLMLDEPEVVTMARLYQQYAPAIFAYLLQHTPAAQDAEDLLVEVFLAALESKKFSTLPEKAQLAWLWRVARNKTVDAYRRAVRRQSIALEHIAESINDDDASNPEQIALRQEEYTDLQDHLKSLSTLQQEVLWLRFSQNMHCSEIAAHLGKREGAVKVMLSRALNMLKHTYKA